MNIFTVGFKHPRFKVATLNEAIEFLSKRKAIALDIETTHKYGGKYEGEGLDPYLSKIVMIQVGTEDVQYIIDARKLDVSPLKSILENESIKIIGHNLKFEYKHLFHNYGIRINSLHDTMIVEQIMYNGFKMPFSLEDLNKRYLGIQVNKDTRLEFASIRNKDFSDKQIMYGAEDIAYPYKIYHQQLERSKKQGDTNCINLEMKYIQVLGDLELKGMNFNVQTWTETYNKNKKEFDQTLLRLNEFIIDNFSNSRFIEAQLDLFSDEVKTSISWSSPKQVADFFIFLNICPKQVSDSTGELTYTVNAGVLKSSLNTINKDIPEHYKEFINTYLKYKELEKACSTYGLDYFKYIHPITKRLHSNFKQILNTGRISSSKPNLQNVPSEHGFRSAFDAPEGFKIVNADYSGQEQIILANKSQDKDLISFYRQGLGDMHSFVASKIFPDLADIPLKEIKANHSDKRQIAKAAGFAINYGGNGYTIAENLGIPQEQGEKVYEAYFKAFPGLKAYFDKVKRQSIRKGFILIDPLTNRKTWFYKPKSIKEIGQIERNALNYPIQGEAGSITKYASILYRKWIIQNNYEKYIAITNMVHDEINVEAADDYAEIAAEQLEKCMEKAGDKWCKIIPLKADAVVTTYWTH